MSDNLFMYDEVSNGDEDLWDEVGFWDTDDDDDVYPPHRFRSEFGSCSDLASEYYPEFDDLLNDALGG